MKRYTFELFDTRNTARMNEQDMESIAHASMYAKILSRKYHHVVVALAGAWEEWTAGELTSWSVPNGLGKK